MVEYLSLLHVGCSQVSRFAHRGGYSLFHLPLLSYVPEETLLVIFYIPSQVQLQLCLGFPDPFPALPGHIPIMSSGCISLPPLPMHFVFVF